MECTAGNMLSVSLCDALLIFGFTQCSENRSEWEQKWPTLGHKPALFCCSPRDDSQEKRLKVRMEIRHRVSSARRAAPRDFTVGVVSLGVRLCVIDRGCGILIQITAEILSGVMLTSLLYRSASARGSGGRGMVVGRGRGGREASPRFHGEWIDGQRIALIASSVSNR